jgi:nucleotide-binding universal stress UspA family protein
MMSSTAIFSIGVSAVLMLGIFVYVTMHEIKTSPPGVKPFRGLLPIDENVPKLETAQKRSLRIVLATDGSPCSDRAVQSVAMRPWPADSQIEVVSVVHTRTPAFPDVELMIEAAHVEALAADRERAPARVQRAILCLTEAHTASVTGKVLEGDPGDAILEEAERWQADLIVVGSHGFGPIKRRLLGSVSQAIALHAPCSVEIVRCPHSAA